jgi:hypothetical protein
VQPQSSPFASFHWQRPPSRVQTSRNTRAGMCSGFDGRGFCSGRSTRPRRFATCASVLRRDHLGGLDDARQAELSPAERLDDCGDLLDQLRRDLAVLGGALRQVQLAVQEVKERRVAQLGPRAAMVEVRERDEELGERVVLAAEERGEVLGESVSGLHAKSLSCDLRRSRDAPGRALARRMAPDTAARLEAPLRRRRPAGRAQGGVLAVLAPRLPVSSDRASSVSLGSVEGLSMPPRTASAPRFTGQLTDSEATAGLAATRPPRASRESGWNGRLAVHDS